MDSDALRSKVFSGHYIDSLRILTYFGPKLAGKQRVMDQPTNLWTDQQTKRPNNGPTDQQTNGGRQSQMFLRIDIDSLRILTHFGGKSAGKLSLMDRPTN